MFRFTQLIIKFMLVIIFVLIALLLSVPAADNFFAGILVTYAGMTLLNVYPFHKSCDFRVC